MKLINKRNIIKCSIETEVISQSEITKRTGLSGGAVSYLIGELVKEDYLVEERLGEFQGGRRPVLYRINKDKAYMIICKIESTSIIIALANLKGELIESRTIIGQVEGEKKLIALLGRAVIEIKSCAELIFKQVCGIAISIPGIINFQTKTVVLSSRLKLKDVNLQKIFSKLFAREVNVELFKDTDALLLGEYYFENNSYKDIAYILCNKGVGLSLLLNEKLFRTSQAMLELGHMTIDPHGPFCHCGRRGCIGAMISELPAIRRYVEINEELGTKVCNISDITFKEIIMAITSDEVAKRVIEEQLHLLAEVVVNIVNMFQVDHIIIGGPFSLLREDLQEKLQETVNQNSLVKKTDKITIQGSMVEDRLVLEGMARELIVTEVHHMKF